MSNEKIHFKGCDCIVNKNSFVSGGIALTLIVDDTQKNQAQDYYPGEAFGTPSAFVDNQPLKESQTILKDYSEYEGITDILINAGLVRFDHSFFGNFNSKFNVVTVLF